MGRRRIASLSVGLLALLVLFALAAHGEDAPSLLRPDRALAGHPATATARAVAPVAMTQSDGPPDAALLARVASRGDAVGRAAEQRTILRQGSRRRREIALTFDDGPSQYTKAVLRILRRAHAHATFFPIGYSLGRYPGALADEVREGDVIGDHTVDHKALGSLGYRAQLGEIRGQARMVARQGLPEPTLLRPPYGSYDARTESIARGLGMLMVMWTVDSQDYTRPGRKAIVRRVMSGARPGAIILMHDGGGPREQTVSALATIIRRLRSRGFRLVTVPELLRKHASAR